jgi:hypothetical protein
MSKTLLAHDVWYTSLQLLEMGVDVEDGFWVVGLLW